MKRLIVFALALLTMFSQPVIVSADGIIIPEPPICPRCPVPPPPEREVPYLTVENHRVNVTINDQVATTRVDQLFRNDSQWSLEGTYIFPMPENAAISDFAMWVNGERVDGQIYTKEEARRIYDNILRRRLDPALLEYVGRDLFQASIFPIDPGDTRRVEIEYTELLPLDNGLVQYIYPLSTERFSARPLEKVAITVDIESTEALKTIYSASHPVGVAREGRYRAAVGWEESDVLPNKDFNLYYTVSSEDVGGNLLTHKQRGEDGFFVFFVAPNVDAGQQDVVDKDVLLVLDTSGSMEGEKMSQAREALKFVLDHLNQDDRFNIIAFSTGVQAFSTRLESTSSLAAAHRFVDRLEPGGSTDINRALLETIASADRQRPTIIIFLTDGLPTSGVVETPLILNNLEQVAGDNLRIFPFGVGDDVDTLLLDTMAQEMRGTTAYVRPGERIDEQVNSFYAKVSTPILTDLTLQVSSNIVLEDTYPYPLPDLFAGTQLVVTGRYRQGGPATITLSGEVNGQRRTYRFDDLTFATDTRATRQADFIPRLWATRKIGYLLNQIRLHGESREAIDEIVNLSVRYGIITPYTSFLVEEPEMALSNEGRSRLVDDEFAEAMEAPAMDSYGGAAVERAVEQNALSEAEMAAPLPTGKAAGDSAEKTTSAVTAVGDKAFVLKNGVWTDTAFDADRLTPTALPFPSEQFFEFLNEHPETGKYFALGPQVIVILDGQAYETVPDDVSEASLPATSDDPSTTPESATTGYAEVQLILTADVTTGQAPLPVNLTGELVGNPEDEARFTCAAFTFDFGDGLSQEITPQCPASAEQTTLQRQFQSNYIYDKPGLYTATFTLDNLTSQPVTIIVKESSQEKPGNPAAESDSSESSLIPTPADETAQASVPQNRSSNCLLGLSLSFFSLMVGLKWLNPGLFFI